jgi:hypothetical protein
MSNELKYKITNVLKKQDCIELLDKNLSFEELKKLINPTKIQMIHILKCMNKREVQYLVFQQEKITIEKIGERIKKNALEERNTINNNFNTINEEPEEENLDEFIQRKRNEDKKNEQENIIEENIIMNLIQPIINTPTKEEKKTEPFKKIMFEEPINNSQIKTIQTPINNSQVKTIQSPINNSQIKTIQAPQKPQVELTADEIKMEKTMKEVKIKLKTLHEITDKNTIRRYTEIKKLLQNHIADINEYDQDEISEESLEWVFNYEDAHNYLKKMGLNDKQANKFLMGNAQDIKKRIIEEEEEKGQNLYTQIFKNYILGAKEIYEIINIIINNVGLQMKN